VITVDIVVADKMTEIIEMIMQFFFFEIGCERREVSNPVIKFHWRKGSEKFSNFENAYFTCEQGKLMKNRELQQKWSS